VEKLCDEHQTAQEPESENLIQRTGRGFLISSALCHDRMKKHVGQVLFPYHFFLSARRWQDLPEFPACTISEVVVTVLPHRIGLDAC
jgi:hypothetical protein